jgi:hypothetical protein
MSTVLLHGANGQGGDMARLLATMLGHGPDLAWAEPVPTRGRIQGLNPLLTGASIQAGFSAEVEEARLFWRGATLHLCRGDECVRWAAIWESEAPPWLGALRPPTPVLLGEHERVERTVLTKRDLARYGLPEAGWPEAVRLIEYRQGTRLAFWRMEKEGGR